MAFQPVEITQGQIDELDAMHDGVFVARGKERAPFVYVLRRPEEIDLVAYNQKVKKGDSFNANILLLKRVCVAPKKEDVERQLARWPASASAVITSDSFAEFFGGALDLGKD